MSEILKKINPEWPLRLGFGLMYLYAGFHLFNDPAPWRSYLPVWYAQSIGEVMSVELYLRLQGIVEIVAGLLFLAWFFGRRGVLVGTLYALVEFLLILLLTGVDLITFRDIGLLGGAIALLILIFSSHTNSPVQSNRVN